MKRVFFWVFLILNVLVLVGNSQVAAYTQNDFDCAKNDNCFYSPNACPGGAGAADADSLLPGSGAPNGAQFPNLDPTAMASAINSFIQKENPNSEMKGLGQTIVADGRHSNVNPFLIVAIAHMESGLADPGDYNVAHGNNSFGRTAAAGQPSFQGAKTWYKWSSVKASVDYSAPENQNVSGGGDFASYLRSQFGNQIDNGTMEDIFSLYDPGYSGYASMVKGWIRTMVKDVQSGGGVTPSGNGNNVYLVGDSILVGAYYDNGSPLKNALDKDGWSSQADASGGRGMAYAGSDPRGNLPGKTKSGLDAIAADSAAIKASDTVVIELGTNESNVDLSEAKSANIFKDQVEQAISEVKAINKNASIYWVNLFSKQSRPYEPYVNAYNQVIQSVAQAKGINVIDTKNAGISLSPDGIHPDAAGYKTLSRVIAEGVNNSASDSATPGSVSACCPDSGPVSLGSGTLPSYIKEPYNSIFSKAAQKYNIDPAVLVALFYNEQYGYTNSVSEFNSHNMPDPPPPYGHGPPWATSSAAAQGPFQFIPSTWAIGGVDGNGDGKKDPEDLTDESFAAAKGASDGLFGGIKINASSSKDDVALMATHYYGDNSLDAYGIAAGKIFELVRADEAGGGGGAGGFGGGGAGGCQAASVGGGTPFILGDYAWPVDITKSEIDSGYPWPCPGNCHHDGTAAFDLSTKKAVGGDEADAVGRAEFAITDGTVDVMDIYMGIPGCYSMEFHSSTDGYVYWYGHMRKPTVHAGDKVKVGQKVGEIGESKCTGNGSYPHLHIDRGSPKGAPGGLVCCRDPGITPLINKLYAHLPN